MVRLAIQIKAELEGVTELQPIEPGYEWYFKIKCTSCNEENENTVSFNRDEDHSISGSRGEANFVWRCKFCKKESSAAFEAAKPSQPVITPYISDRIQFQTLTIVECRGMEITDFEPRGTWRAKGLETGTAFTEIEFDNGEWTDYDEKASAGVSIMDFESKIVRA